MNFKLKVHSCWTLDSHTNTVISHTFGYSSRWHWKPWPGLFLCFLKSNKVLLCTPDLLCSFFKFISYIFQRESDKYIQLSRISWLRIPIQSFEFPTILSWFNTHHAVTTVKGSIRGVIIKYWASIFIKLSKSKMTVKKSAKINFKQSSNNLFTLFFKR